MSVEEAAPNVRNHTGDEPVVVEDDEVEDEIVESAGFVPSLAIQQAKGLIAKEATRKSSVHLEQIPPGTKTSPLWDYLYQVSKQPAEGKPISSNQYVCKLCYEDSSKKLDACLIKLCNRNISNCWSHMQRKHPTVAEMFRSQNPSVKKRASDGDIRDYFGATTNPNALTAERMDAQLMKTVVSMNLPDRCAWNDNMRDLVKMAIRFGRLPDSHKYKPCGRYKFKRHRAEYFTLFTDLVKEHVDMAREAHALPDGTKMPFISVGHDIWDAISKEKLGVSIFFFNPITWKYYRLAVGLVDPSSHKAVEISEETIQVLGRYGIVAKTDLFRSVNDNTNAAVAAGRLLSSEGCDGQCTMHLVQLAIGHALGLKTRSNNRIVVDKFQHGADIIKIARDVVAFLNPKKSHSNFVLFKQTAKEWGLDVIKMDLDNETRVSGALRLLQAVLRSKPAIELHQASSRSNANFPAITPQNWVQIAEFEAILREVGNHAFTVQNDMPGSSALSWVWTSFVKHSLACGQFDVVDLLRRYSWNANTLFKDLPLATMSIDQMTPESQQLRDRFIAELDRYLPQPDDDQLLAMACHPLVVTIGRRICSALNKDQWPAIWDKAMKLLDDQIATYAAAVAIPAPAESSTIDAEHNNGNKSSRRLDSLYEDIDCASRSSTDDCEGDTPLATIKQEKERFMKMKMNWAAWLRLQLADESKKQATVEWDDVKKNRFHAIAPWFDVSIWWRKHRDEYPTLSQIAARYIAKPDSNGFQERVFSRCTVIDHPLRQRLKEENFEMSVLLSKNIDFIEEMQQGPRTRAAVVTEKHISEVLERAFQADAGEVKELLEGSTDDEDVDDFLNAQPSSKRVRPNNE